MSKREKHRKERYMAITMRYSEPIRINGVQIRDGSIIMMSDGKEQVPEYTSYEIGLTGERKNKPNKITLYSEATSLSLNDGAIMNGFSILVALDTNYKNGMAASAGIIFSISKSETGYNLDYINTLVKKFSYTGLISPELIALNDFINQICYRKQDKFLDNARIKFVIDHNLGDLEKYNSGEQPLVEGDEDSFLPDRIKLMYASTDKKHDSVFSELLCEADRIATEIRKGKVSFGSDRQ